MGRGACRVARPLAVQPRFRPEARQEVLDAQAWYEARVPGLGLQFADAVEEAVTRMCETPLAFSPVGEDFRRVVMRRFPYSIIYHVDGPDLVIVSCFHHRRRPANWGTGKG